MTYYDTRDEDAAEADLANDDAVQRELDQERAAFEAWYERANLHDVINRHSAERAWFYRAGV